MFDMGIKMKIRAIKDCKRNIFKIGDVFELVLDIDYDSDHYTIPCDKIIYLLAGDYYSTTKPQSIKSKECRVETQLVPKSHFEII
ncbi:hypothetical protein phiOC_p255 [Ochrobactrum phage vB_OspM_OC]|nr:hypothetical protein phiOC_p255 [Ochrobactrum phage vB_OspM_OC]